MRLLITGATGFLGRYVVGEALRRGHAVRAVVRPAGDVDSMPWADDPALELARVDLRSKRGLVEAVEGVDTVIHAAAAKSGDFYAQFAGTVIATENLLDAMAQAGVNRIVAISTFSVYDYMAKWSFSCLDEDSPLERNPTTRDEYAQTKLIQEQLVLDTAKANGWNATVLRPGVIWGKDNTWTARLGAGGEKTRTWLRIGAWARLPLTYVENCAEAIVMAAEADAARGQILNVVDDDPPTQRKYAALLRRRLPKRVRIIPVPWTLMRVVASMAWLTNRLLLGGRAKLPGILVPARLHARFKPLRFSNRRIKRVLGWEPRYSLTEAMDRCFAPAPQPEARPEPVAV